MPTSAITALDSPTPRRRSGRLKGEQATPSPVIPDAGGPNPNPKVDDNEPPEQSKTIQIQSPADEDAKDELLKSERAEENLAKVEGEQQGANEAVVVLDTTPGTALKGTRQARPTRVLSWAEFSKAPCASTISYSKPYSCDHEAMVVPNGPRRRDSIHPKATPSQPHKRIIEPFDLTSAEALRNGEPAAKRLKADGEWGFPYTNLSSESAPGTRTEVKPSNGQSRGASRSVTNSVSQEHHPRDLLEGFDTRPSEFTNLQNMLHGSGNQKGKRYQQPQPSRPTSRQPTVETIDDIEDDGPGVLETKKPYTGTANLKAPRSIEQVKEQLRSRRKLPEISPHFSQSEQLTVSGLQKTLVGGGNIASTPRGTERTNIGSKRNSAHVVEDVSDEEDVAKKPRRGSHTHQPPSSSLSRAGNISSQFPVRPMFKKTSERDAERVGANFPVRLVKSRNGSCMPTDGISASLRWSATHKGLRVVVKGSEAQDSYPELPIDPQKIQAVKCSKSEEPDGRFFIKSMLPMAPEMLIELEKPEQTHEFIQFLRGFQADMKIYQIESGKMKDIFENMGKQMDKHIFEFQQPSPRNSSQRHGNFEVSINAQSDIRKDQLADRSDHVSEPKRKLVNSLTREMKTAESRAGRERPQIFPHTDLERPATRSTRRQHIELHRSPSPTFESWTEQNRHWQDRFWRGDEPLIYPPEGDKRATVDRRDIERLNEGEFLNDNLLQFYLRYLEENIKTKNPDVAKRVLFMNPFFYQRLTRGKGRSHIDYDGIKRWTSKFDIFKYDYVIVPVNEHAHWYLAVICNTPAFLKPQEDEPKVDENDTSEADTSLLEVEADPAAAKKTEADSTTDVEEKVNSMTIEDSDTFHIVEDKTATTGAPTSPQQQKKRKKKPMPPPRKYKPHEPRIITMDSLGFPHSPTCSNLKEFLIAEAKARHGVDVVLREKSVGMTAKNIPEQNNHCDCGLFLLGYVEYFLDNPDGMMHDLMQQKPEVVERFSKLDARKMRADIRQLLFDLKKEQANQEATKDACIAKRRAEKARDAGDSIPSTTEPTPAASPRAIEARSSDENKTSGPNSSRKSSIEPAEEEPSLIEVDKPPTPAAKVAQRRSASPASGIIGYIDELAGYDEQAELPTRQNNPNSGSLEVVGSRFKGSPSASRPVKQTNHLTTSKSVECMGSREISSPVGSGDEFAARNAMKASSNGRHPESLPSSDNEPEMTMSHVNKKAPQNVTTLPILPPSASQNSAGKADPTGPTPGRGRGRGRGRGASSDLDAPPRKPSVVDLASDEEESHQVRSEPPSRDLRTKPQGSFQSSQLNTPSKGAADTTVEAQAPKAKNEKNEEVIIPVKLFRTPAKLTERIAVKRSQSQTQTKNGHGATHTRFDDNGDGEMLLNDVREDSLTRDMSPSLLNSPAPRKQSMEVQISPGSSRVTFPLERPNKSIFGPRTSVTPSGNSKASLPAMGLRTSPRSSRGRESATVMKERFGEPPPLKKNSMAHSSPGHPRTQKSSTVYGSSAKSTRASAPKAEDTKKGGEKEPIVLE